MIAPRWMAAAARGEPWAVAEALPWRQWQLSQIRTARTRRWMASHFRRLAASLFLSGRGVMRPLVSPCVRARVPAYIAACNQARGMRAWWAAWPKVISATLAGRNVSMPIESILLSGHRMMARRHNRGSGCVDG